MNPEYFFDGQLFESQEEWEKAFATDPDGTVERLAKMQKSLEEEFSEQPTDALDPEPLRDLITSCREALNKLLASLPTDLGIFPTEDEKRAVLAPVSNFSAQLNELLTPFWELYHSLERDCNLLGALSAKAQKAQSALFVAFSASKKFGLAIALGEILGDCVCTTDSISSDLRDRYKLHEALNDLYHSFFCEFLEKLVEAADIEHEGASASPVKIYELCGGARATLRLIENRMFPRSFLEFPLA